MKDGRFDAVEMKIRQIHESMWWSYHEVIRYQAALLTEGKIIKTCEVVTKAGAEFVGTSTGFSDIWETVALMSYVGRYSCRPLAGDF